MENAQHIKGLNTDSRGKNRIRYAPNRERAKRASADVYRSYKRRIGVTSAASREERVHYPNQEESSKRKRQKRSSDQDEAVVESDESSDDLDTAESTFGMELDLAHDRNASEIFTKFHREIWPLVRSLPEVLHHAPAIMELCMAYLLSLESDPGTKSPGSFTIDAKPSQASIFVVNHATTDVLHLLAVLARDLRHEIHPYVHTLIVPRIVYDMLNPPPPPKDKQPIPLHVTLVEAAFRTLAHVFRYDMQSLLNETVGDEQQPCLEPMRQYYGATLGHRRDVVRRLAAETFAPLVRKLKSDSLKKKHLKRVVRALSANTNSQARAMSDAIDGVSMLLFQTAKGVSGQLHSKGNVVIKCMIDCVISNKSGDTVYLIASAFLEKLVRHLNDIQCVWKELFKATDGLLSQLDNKQEALCHLLRLLEQTVSFRDGYYLKQANSAEYVKKLLGLLERLLQTDTFESLSGEAQTVTLTLLCTSWKALPNHVGFSSRLSKLLPGVLSKSIHHDGARNSSPAHVLAKDLMPFLPRELAMKHVGSYVLSAAAQLASKDANASLQLVHSVATARLDEIDNEDDNKDDDDSLFIVANAVDCDVSLQDQVTLLDLSLVDIMEETDKREALAKLGYACPCLPFVARVGDDDEKENKRIVKSITKWIHATLKHLDEYFSTLSSDGSDGFEEMDVVVAKSSVLGALAAIVMGFMDRMPDMSVLRKALDRAKSSALQLQMSHPSSIWAVKSVSAIVEALQRSGLQLSDSPDEVFDALTSNLRQESHYLRLHTLRILNSYPTKPFVTDHADLDLTDDLDEEPSGSGTKAGQAWASSQVSGPCDILSTLLTLEATPVNINNERQLTSLITRVEVLGRTGKLPVAYAEAASNHMFGIFYTKFAPLWPAAIKALVALASAHEDCAWPPIEAMMKKVMVPSSGDSNGTQRSKGDESSDLMGIMEYHYKRVAWDESGGRDYRLFVSQVKAAQEDGRVSRHQHTDSGTIFELVWSVMEGVPQVTTKKSRVVVPVFLGFLHLQYYLFHENDPDAREFRLDEHVKETASWTRSDLTRKSLQRKLCCFLKMFAAINGPQQLYKHAFLLSIFSAFLSHQDAGTAQLALSCVLKYKLPYAMPYADHLKGMLKKGELRNALINFDISKESGIVDSEYRSALIPLVSRILFGRLTARVSGGKSSRDSPAARRAAVLSFLSVLGENDHELDPFIYLMIRSFVPAGVVLQPVEKRSADDRLKLITAMQSVQARDVSVLHRQRQEGFLNLLSDVISQLGYGVKNYVSTFISIVLALCEYAEVGKPSDVDKGSLDHEQQDENPDDSSPSLARVGIVRTLCFRRLEELLEQYTSSFDFMNHAQRLWGATGASIHMLPGTVVNAVKAPALLSLLETVSSHEQLIPMLSSWPESVESVIKCIANTSRKPIIDAALRFVDNLLINGQTDSDSGNVNYDSPGVKLIRQHVPLLMQQFTYRLNSTDSVLGGSTSQKATRKSTANSKTDDSTWRELAILCRVSDLAVHDEVFLSAKGESETKMADVLSSLCELLIPFLGHGGKASEADQLNVLSILNRIVPKIEREVALSHLPALSKVLGPHKAGSGITSLSVRQALASVIATISNCVDGNESLVAVSTVLSKLCATHRKRVDEVDYDQLIPALNGLGEIKSENSAWLRLSGCEAASPVKVSSMTSSSDTAVLSPLIYTCFHLLFDDDGVVSRGAFKALKTLICSASQRAELEVKKDSNSEEARRNHWVMLAEKTIVPSIRPGLNAKNHSVRRYFVLLLAEISRCFKDYASPNLYGDLSSLLRSDDPELDFFLNITHVQIHRRSRALQRLRKMLNSDAAEENGVQFTLQSLSNVLLPLAMHPVYECKAKTEETYALEAIATVGAIGKCLSWSKYHNALWTALTQFPRHPEQERYLIGMICALIDAFHFQVAESNGLDSHQNSPESSPVAQRSSSGEQGSAVWRALEKRIIPKVESYLTKEKVDRSGTKVKTLRSPVVLAMLKLFRKFPVSFFESKLPRLLAIICDALKNRDSDARDVARTTLAKMSVEIDMGYLSDVIRELAVTLTEGYQLHVRSATLHSILLEISKDYERSKNVSNEISASPPFDGCVPAMMDLVQQDLFGEATERKEAEGVQKRYIKEAAGSKSVDSIELICRMLYFKPSISARNEISGVATNLSSVHCVVSPLLKRLRDPDVATRTIGKIRECLNRVVLGLSHNSSAEAEEIFPFVYASIEPFIGAYSVIAADRDQKSGDGDDSSDDESGMKPIRVSRTGKEDTPTASTSSGTKGASNIGTNVVEWRPSTLNAAKSGGDALGKKNQERRALGKVKDGTSAPKLTGSSRYVSMAKSSRQGLNDPAGISAVIFGLSLLQSVLKRTKRDFQDARILSMMDPFIPTLTTCVCVCRDNDVILLSLRCLGSLLRMDLPSVSEYSKTLGTKTLDLLTSSGALSNLHHELTQGCFKTLTLLINMEKEVSNELAASSQQSKTSAPTEGVPAIHNSKPMPLDSEQMQVLISLLQAAADESEHHNSTFALIKSITSRRFVSPEFYDLMDTMLQLSVRSQKPTVRQQSSLIFMHYLVDYPMGKQRLEGHLKQLVLNIKYEYEEGRLSAIGLLTAIIEKLPLPLLEEHAQLFFMPLVLQLVNDESKECREAVAKCLSRLLNRASMDVVQSFYDYAVRWSQGTGPLQRTSLQLFGLFVDARLDFIKRGNTAQELIDRIYKQLKLSLAEGQDEWEVPYFSLVCLEKLTTSFPTLVAQHADLWMVFVSCLVNPHPWVKQVSSRMLLSHLTTINSATFADKKAATFLLKQPGSLFEIAQNLCAQLNVSESDQNEELTTTAIKSLTWVIQAMHKYPQLCYAEDEADSDEEIPSQSRNPVTWLVTRLSNMAKPKGEKRREAVFKCFAAFTSNGGASIVSPYLELMLEPMHRSIVELENATEHAKTSRKPHEVSFEEGDLAKDVMQLLEDQCGTEAFLEAYAAVKIRAREKREQRKQQRATEAVQDPQAAAERKIRKHQSERKRRKRRVEERRAQRGGTAKRRHLD